MKKTKRTLPLCCVFCLILAIAPPFAGPLSAQEETAEPGTSPTGTKTTLAEAVRKSTAHDRPIERFSEVNADVRAVFQQLAKYSGTDIVVGDKVSGSVTLDVTNKTWREILAIVCKITSLTAIREPTYIYIVPSEEYHKQQLADATANQQEEALEELKREVIPCNNSKAQEMMNSVQSLLSVRGKITVVERNNALIIYDTPDNIAQIRKTIQELDVETNQVFISCKIIEVNSGVAKDLGIGWGYFDRIGGTDVSATHIPGFSVPGELERLTFGILSQDKLSATLSLLFQNTGAEIVAQPQITTLDNKEATVFLGSQIPIQTMTTAGGGSTGQFIVGTPTITMVDAGTNLIVTPHVTSEKRIMLTLSSTKSSYTLTGTGTNPIINKQSAQTNVVVSDGETVVIAGLTSNETQTVTQGIPVLKDIPLLGNLFKHSKKTVKKDDLMIFVTPHIINKKVEAVSGAVK